MLARRSSFPRTAPRSRMHSAPVQADLNGDGAREVLLVTHALELLLLSPQPAPTAASGSGFGRATLKTRQKVPISSVVLGETQPVALAAGYLDAPDPDHKHARRKMVVVVVTAGWLVLCLDHNLNVLWQKSLHGHFPHHASVREVRRRTLRIARQPRATSATLDTRTPHVHIHAV